LTEEWIELVFINSVGRQVATRLTEPSESLSEHLAVIVLETLRRDNFDVRRPSEQVPGDLLPTPSTKPDFDTAVVERRHGLCGMKEKFCNVVCPVFIEA
jgi:hypothetical protein